MVWCFSSRRADPFSDDESGSFEKKCLSPSLRTTPDSLPATQETTFSTQEMEVVLSKADGAHAEGSWAVGGKQQDSSLDGHGPVVMAQRPEEHEKFAALAKAHQEQEQLVQALKGQVTSLVSKMENMQLQQLDVQSMLSSFTPKSGDLSSAQEALHEAHAHELPEASLDTALPGQPGAAGVAGSGRSNAEEEGMLATLTQRITALEAVSQRLAATEDGLAGLERLCTREDGMGLVPRSEMTHALENVKACLGQKGGVQSAITDRQQQFFAQVKADALSAKVLDRVLVELEPGLEFALEGAKKATQHAEKTSDDIQDLQLVVRQTNKKVEELSKGLILVADKMHDRLANLDAAQQQLAERLSAVEEKAKDKPLSCSPPYVSADERRQLLKFWSDRGRARGKSGHSEILPLPWPNGRQKQASLARNSAATCYLRQSQADQYLERGSRKSEEQIRAVQQRRSQAGDAVANSGKLPDEILDSFGSSVVLQQPPSSKCSTRTSYTGIPNRRGITTGSVVVQPTPYSKRILRASSEEDDDDVRTEMEQKLFLSTRKGSTFSRPTEATTTPAQAAFAASGNNGRSSGRSNVKKLASFTRIEPFSGGSSLSSARLRKLD